MEQGEEPKRSSVRLYDPRAAAAAAHAVCRTLAPMTNPKFTEQYTVRIGNSRVCVRRLRLCCNVKRLRKSKGHASACSSLARS